MKTTFSPNLLAGAVLALLTACALGPIQPDRQARAPVLPGFGELRVPITTSAPAAQAQFVQGVLQAYAFNEVEAVRMFKAALAQDPQCAMCAWGVAWQLGPNINNTSRQRVPEALRYVDLALAHSSRATAREQALIQALALRYGHGSEAKAARQMAPLLAERCGAKGAGEAADPLDLAYAERLRSLVEQDPLDPERLSLWAEAEMIATRSDWWDEKTGKPGGRIGEVASALERGLATQPLHTGLNHYLIHAVDARGVAQRAVAAADRLGRLAPAAPHLVHMPSHTYGLVGRYADAARVNEEAVAADLRLAEAQKAQGFSVSKDWRHHNQHYLWFAALMQGRGDAAVQAAREISGRFGTAEFVYAEYVRALPALALLRLQRWDALRAEAVPAGKHGLSPALGEGARGVALARGGRLAEAREALGKAEAGAAQIAKAHTAADGFDRTLRDLADSATGRLRAEIASAEGRHDEALAAQTLALAAADRADDSEPPMLAAAARSALGDLQLRAGRAVAAERSFRDDLARLPANGWALSGLIQALRAQGRQAEAETLRPQLAQAWAQADQALLRAR